jgi:DNA uptake protein ComE-like DNA-binding protein
MVDLGMKATDDEMKQLLDTSRAFQGRSAEADQLERATSVELESVRAAAKEAAVDRLPRQDACKTLDDLKKVPGVPFKKIDDRRDRLVCF